MNDKEEGLKINKNEEEQLVGRIGGNNGELLINDDKNNNKDESLEVVNEEDEEKFTLTFPTNSFD
jgi:hypothetical protein